MAGFCDYGCTGLLTIGGQVLNTPAFDVPNLVHLWTEGVYRGDNRLVPALAGGRRGNPLRLDAAEFDLAFAITGSATVAGVANTNEWVGLQANLDLLWTNVFAPVTTGRGTRVATITMPSGAVRTADVQVDPLHFANDIDDPGFVESTIHLTVVSGRFV